MAQWKIIEGMENSECVYDDIQIFINGEEQKRRESMNEKHWISVEPHFVYIYYRGRTYFQPNDSDICIRSNRTTNTITFECKNLVCEEDNTLITKLFEIIFA